MLTGDQSEESTARQRLEKILSVCFNSLQMLATKDMKTIAGSPTLSLVLCWDLLVLHAWKKNDKQAETSALSRSWNCRCNRRIGQ